MLDGYTWRMNRDAETAATWVCTILNGAGHLKQRITPAQLLGRPMAATVAKVRERKS